MFRLRWSRGTAVSVALCRWANGTQNPSTSSPPLVDVAATSPRGVSLRWHTNRKRCHHIGAKKFAKSELFREAAGARTASLTRLMRQSRRATASRDGRQASPPALPRRASACEPQGSADHEGAAPQSDERRPLRKPPPLALGTALADHRAAAARPEGAAVIPALGAPRRRPSSPQTWRHRRLRLRGGASSTSLVCQLEQ